MRVILFGATGMVGQAVLLECLEDPGVSRVLSIGRRATTRLHEKLVEIVHDDFTDYSGIAERLAGYSACFFCLGVSSVGMNEATYRRITYDFPLAAGEALGRQNPQLVFCYVSGEGTDSTERSRTMWARVKGQTENALQALPFAGAYMFRPGYIHPLKGVTPQATWMRVVYWVLRPFYPVLEALAPRHVTTTTNMGRAMIRVTREVGSRPGTVARRTPLGCVRGFPLRARIGSSVAPFPGPASSNGACGFPALRLPAGFPSRAMGPIEWHPLSAGGPHDGLGTR